jgi:hypothetical protein
MMSNLFEYMNGHGGFFNSQVASAVFGQGDTGSLHLALAGLAPQLRDDLVDLRQA